MKPITDMTPEELRIACAGKCEKSTNIHNVDGYSGKVFEYPDYEHDRNALFALINTIPKYKHNDFIKALTDILDFDLQLFTDGETLAGNITDVIWDLLIADPIAIMRAFLTVMEDNQ